MLHASSGHVVDGYGEITSKAAALEKHSDGHKKNDHKVFTFNDAALRGLAFTQAGDFVLRYEALPVREGLSFQNANPSADPRDPPTASLHVRVLPGRADSMRLQLMEKTLDDEKTWVEAEELLLGRRYAIEATFTDQHDNVRTLDREGVKTVGDFQMTKIREETLAGKTDPCHFVSAKEIQLEYDPNDEQPPYLCKLLPKNKTKPVEKIQCFWGGHGGNQNALKDYREISPVLPSAEAIQERFFSRTEARVITVTARFYLPDPDEPDDASKYFLVSKVQPAVG